MLPNKNGGASSTDMGSVQHKGVPNVSLNSQDIDRKDKEIPTAPFNSQKEQEKNDLTVIDHMTLEDILKLLESDSLLSDLDDNLKNVKEGEKTIENHKDYFQTQVDNKLKRLCLIYHPDSVQKQGGSEEEKLKAKAMQAKLNGVRNILQHFNEEFSQYDDFKYSYFSKIRVDFLVNEEKLKNITYMVLNKLGELSYIKYERLVPNLNGFLRSSQASIKGFTSNNVNRFLEEKDNAECYFQSYLIGYKELHTNLELFCDLCKENDRMEPIAIQMLNECKTQGKILNKVNDFLNQSQPNFNDLSCEYPYCISNKQSYEQADKDFTLPFVEYTNVLAICNEVINNKDVSKLKEFISNIPIANRFINNEVTHKVAANNKIIRDLGDLSSLHRLSHYLLTYYCYGNKENEKLAAKFLHINPLDKEYALQLLVQVINVYSSRLEKEFQPEKDFYEKVAEVQMNFLKTMKSLVDEFCKDLRQYNEQLYEVNSERNKIVLKVCEEIHEQSEFYEQASESCRQTSESFKKHSECQNEANAKREEELKELLKTVEERLNKPSSSSQQQSADQVDDQPGPSCKLDEVPPISRSQSLDSLHSSDSDIEIISRSQCR